MADDINSSSKPVNQASRVEQIGSANRRSQNIDEVVRRAQQSINKPIAHIRELQQKLSDLRSQRQNLQDELAFALQDDTASDQELIDQVSQINKDLEGTKQSMQSAFGSLRQIRSTTNERTQQRVTSAVSRFVSPGEQESRIRMVGRSSSILGRAVNQAETRGYAGLEQRRSQAMNQAASIAMQIEEAQASGDQGRVASLSGQMQKAEHEAAIASKGIQYLKRRGQDPESRFMRAQSVIDRAQSRFENMEMRDQAQSGTSRGLDEITGEIKQVTEALKGMRDGLQSGNVSLEDFNNETNKLADRFEKLEMEERAVQQAGGGGRWDRFSRGYQLASTAARSLTQVSQAGLVDFRIAQTANAAQIARQQNQQYDAITGAVQGDMMSAMMLYGGFEQAGNFQNAVATGQRNTKLAEAGIEAADTAVGAYTGMKALKAAGRGVRSLFSAEGGVASSALAGATGSASRAAVAGMDVFKGVSEAQAGNAAYQAAIQAQQEMFRVPAKFMQRYSDYAAGLGGITRGAGGGREGLLGTLDSESYVNLLRSQRIGVGRANQLIQQGVNEMGGDLFTGNMASSSLAMSRQMERLGLGSMEQQFGRMGQLANANAVSPDIGMANIMEEAIARGFDNSKAVGMMVDATVSLAQSGATTQMGIDATGGITALIGRAIGGRDPNTANAAEIRAAQTGIQQGGNLLTDRTISFANIQRDVKLREMLGDPLQAASAATLNVTQLETLRKGGSEAEKLIYQKGLTGLIGPNGEVDIKKAQELFNIQGNYLETAGGAGGTGFVRDPEMIERARAVRERLTKQGKSLSDIETIRGLSAEDRAAVLSTNAALNLEAGGNAASMQIRGAMQDIARPKGENPANKVGTRSAAVDAAATRDSVVETEELKRGRERFGGNVANLVDLQKTIETSFSQNIEKFGTAAAEAVENFRNDVNTEVFKGLAKSSLDLQGKFVNLGTTIDTLSTKIANMNLGNAVLPDRDSLLNQVKDAGRTKQ